MSIKLKKTIMKLSKLSIFASILLLSALITSCTQESHLDEKEPEQALLSVPTIENAKTAFTNENKSVHLLTGITEDPALLRKGKNKGYQIDWSKSKQITFKKDVDILYTPVVIDFIKKKQKSFIASVKNKGKN